MHNSHSGCFQCHFAYCRILSYRHKGEGGGAAYFFGGRGCHFLFSSATVMVPPLGLGALHKLRTLHIVAFISHRLDHKGTLASDLKGAGGITPLSKVQFFISCMCSVSVCRLDLAALHYLAYAFIQSDLMRNTMSQA